MINTLLLTRVGVVRKTSSAVSMGECELVLDFSGLTVGAGMIPPTIVQLRAPESTAKEIWVRMRSPVSVGGCSGESRYLPDIECD